MKTIIPAAFLAILLLSPAPGSVSAETIQLTLIPGQAKWAVHLDVQRLAAGPFMQVVENKSPKRFRRWVQKFEAITRIDVFKDIDGITFLGMGSSEQDMVMAISGRHNREHLLNLLQIEEDIKEIPYGRFTIYSWDDDGYGVFADENLILVGGKRSTLEAVLSAHSAGRIAGGNSSIIPVLASVAEGTLLVAAASDLSSLVDDDEASIILQKANSAVLTARESGRQVQVALSLDTDSPETAASMERIINGLMAVVDLRGEHTSKDWEILKSIEISRNGSSVSVKAAGTPEEFMEFLPPMRRIGSILDR